MVLKRISVPTRSQEQATWGQGFGLAAGLPPGVERHIAPGILHGDGVQIFRQTRQIAHSVDFSDRRRKRAGVTRLIRGVHQVQQQFGRCGHQALANRKPVGFGEFFHFGDDPKCPVVSFLNDYSRFGHSQKIFPGGKYPPWPPQ